MNEKVKKILEEQLELLSELSHAKEARPTDIIIYSYVMTRVAKAIFAPTDTDLEKIKETLASVKVDDFAQSLQSLSSQRLRST